MANARFSGIGMTSLRTRQRLVDRLRAEGIKNENVLAVILNTPRHIFLDEALSSRAYEDTALPIGFNQTISQPYIVARMTEVLLGGGGRRRVLEIGTGSGYQTAVLAQLVEAVFTVERLRPLTNRAMAHIRDLRLDNVSFRHHDGCQGWEKEAPYDGVLVTAAAGEVPRALLEQLDVGGRLVIPLEEPGGQILLQIDRTERGFSRHRIESVKFVPLVEGIA